MFWSLLITTNSQKCYVYILQNILSCVQQKKFIDLEKLESVLYKYFLLQDSIFFYFLVNYTFKHQV